jgi:phosphoribosylanthranilate isomerase
MEIPPYSSGIYAHKAWALMWRLYMTKIKICGLSRLIDIDFVNEAVPDYIGFVFADSKRQVSEALAMELRAKLITKIKAVGVFVNEEPDKIVRLCKNNIIDLVQLHGEEDIAYITLLKDRISNPIIKAARVRSREDITKAEGLSSEYLLLDAYKEGQYGGCGDVFDWTVISRVNKPYFLAGGINADNVLQAIAMVKPYGVDVSSGVETGEVKNLDKIIEIIKKVRSVS